MKQLNTIILTLLLGSTSMLYAHDFVATEKSGQKLFFNIVDAKKQYVEITYQGSITSSLPSPYTGEITVPSKVKHKNIIYRVVGISKKAFSEATSLRSITLPSGLQSIGDFAFEGCAGLENVVFPGNSVLLGEGTFFRCTSISHITLGSDWTQINLKMFGWSKQLTSIAIPAKCTRIQNLKSLKQLQSIEVDANNPNFTSINGILYNKEKTILLGCPRAYSGKLNVPEGTTNIRWRALIDCPDITEIDLPASLKILSYREFSRMKHLTQIIMRSEIPILTANTNGQKVFLLQIADHLKVKLIVPKTAQSAYKDALCCADGEYSEISANASEEVSPEYSLVPLIVKSGNLISKGYITGVKNFSKFE